MKLIRYQSVVPHVLFYSILFSLITKLEAKNEVLITGFAPFHGYETNPSWNAVDTLNTTEIESRYNVILSKEEIEVVYINVDLSVPKMLEKGTHLVIHVGASSEVSSFRLEKQAYKKDYIKKDERFRVPALHQNVCDGGESKSTTLDVEAIRDEFNTHGDELRAEISDKAGLYLCEYIYYTSLCYGQHTSTVALFVHVPLDKHIYTTEQLARGLERILDISLRQLSAT